MFLVVVLVIDVDNVTRDKAERDAPVSADSNSPSTFAIPRQRMQGKAWKIHIFRSDRNLESAQNQPQTLHMLRLYSGFRALKEKPLQTFVSKASNHALL